MSDDKSWGRLIGLLLFATIGFMVVLFIKYLIPG